MRMDPRWWQTTPSPTGQIGLRGFETVLSPNTMLGIEDGIGCCPDKVPQEEQTKEGPQPGSDSWRAQRSPAAVRLISARMVAIQNQRRKLVAEHSCRE